MKFYISTEHIQYRIRDKRKIAGRYFCELTGNFIASSNLFCKKFVQLVTKKDA